VRSIQTTDPTDTTLARIRPALAGGDPAMYEFLNVSERNHLVHDRINDLYRTAAELRAPRRTPRLRAGMVDRLRLSIGRRLISFGTVLAAPQC
jgi:hypothetical protein